MENKLTAVQWLVEKYAIVMGLGSKELMKEHIERAKQIEKQQIMKAYGQGIADEAGEILDATKDAQQYYNETFKSE